MIAAPPGGNQEKHDSSNKSPLQTTSCLCYSDVDLRSVNQLTRDRIRKRKLCYEARSCERSSPDFLSLRNAQTIKPSTAWAPDNRADSCLGTRQQSRLLPGSDTTINFQGSGLTFQTGGPIYTILKLYPHIIVFTLQMLGTDSRTLG